MPKGSGRTGKPGNANVMKPMHILGRKGSGAGKSSGKMAPKSHKFLSKPKGMKGY